MKKRSLSLFLLCTTLTLSSTPTHAGWITNTFSKVALSVLMLTKTGSGGATIDFEGDVGHYTSLQLDSHGNPVISYYDDTNEDLKVAVCRNPTCTSGNTLTTVDSEGNVGEYNFLQLNSAGYPVISYFDRTNGDLKVAVCGNPTCTSSNTLITVDSAGYVGGYSSLQLNSDGNPVISYRGTNNGLQVAVCGNPTCTSSNTITMVDFEGNLRDFTSLQLDSLGNPVISYFDYTNRDLKLAVCDNPTCTAGNTITTVDSEGVVGGYISLQLDNNGHPVIGYYDYTNDNLKVVVCGDTTCTSGNNLTNVDSPGGLAVWISLQLNSLGNPVISYTNYDLKIAVCGNPTCTAGNTIITVDSNLGYFGGYTSLQLDKNGNAVISYYDERHQDLKLATINMNPISVDTVKGIAHLDSHVISLQLNDLGNPVMSYYDGTNGSFLKLAVCGISNCTSNNTITAVDAMVGDLVLGSATSLQLGSQGNPVISYLGDQNLKLIVCDDIHCTSGVVKTVDSSWDVGYHSSLQLNSQGNAVISYTYRAKDSHCIVGDLMLAICNDATCTSPAIKTLDTLRMGGYFTSLQLNSKGYPVISYLDIEVSHLKLAICHDINCTFPVIRTLDASGNVHKTTTSLQLNNEGYAVISYCGGASQNLMLAICNDANCTSPFITTLDDSGQVGYFSSLQLSSLDYTVISYFDNANQKLKLAICHDINCTSPLIETIDIFPQRGYFTSLQLNNQSQAFISHYDAKDEKLRLTVVSIAPILSTTGLYNATDPYKTIDLNRSTGNNTAKVVGITLGTIVGIVGIFALLYLTLKKCQKTKMKALLREHQHFLQTDVTINNVYEVCSKMDNFDHIRKWPCGNCRCTVFYMNEEKLVSIIHNMQQSLKLWIDLSEEERASIPPYPSPSDSDHTDLDTDLMNAHHHSTGFSTRKGKSIAVEMQSLNRKPKDLSNRKLKGVDLSGKDLSRYRFPQDLSETNLTNANLSHTDLKNRKLPKDLSNTNLTGANLPKDLSNINFTDAILPKDLSNTNLTGATLPQDLSNINFTGTRLPKDLSSINFTDAILPKDLPNTNLTGARLPQDLSNINFTGARLPQDLSNINLTGARLPQDLSNINFTDAILPKDLSNTNLTGATLPQDLSNINFTDAILPKDLSNINFINAELPQDLSNKNFTGSNLSNHNFTSIKFKNASLKAVTLKETTCDYRQCFEENIKEYEPSNAWETGHQISITFEEEEEKKDQTANSKHPQDWWYTPHLLNDLATIAERYKYVHEDERKAKLLHIASGLAYLPLYKLYIKKGQYWSYQLSLLNIKKENVALQPLHRFTSYDMMTKINHYILSDCNFQEVTKHMAEKIFYKERFHGQNFLRGNNDSKQINYLQMLFEKETKSLIEKRLLSKETLEKIFNALTSFIEHHSKDNPNHALSLSAEETAFMASSFPLNKLLENIEKERIDGKGFLERYKARKPWIHEITGWDKTDVVLQIESILLQYFTHTEDKIKNKISKYLQQDKNLFLQKLKEKKIDLELLQLKVRHNSDIKNETALLKEAMIEITNSLEEAVNSPRLDFQVNCYQALAKALCVNSVDKKSMIEEKEEEKSQFDEKKTIAVCDARTSWTCYYCGNFNHFCTVGGNQRQPICCHLCGIPEKESISLKLKQVITFTNRKKDKEEIDHNDSSELEKFIDEGHKKHNVSCPCLVGEDKVCEYVVRLTRLLSYYKKFIIEAKDQKAKDSTIDFSKIKFTKKHFENAIDQAFKGVTSDLADSKIQTKIRSSLLSTSHKFFALGRKNFINNVAKLLGNKRLKSNAGKLYNSIKTLLLKNIWDTIDPRELDKDYHHIVKYHMDDSYSGGLIAKENVFGYFQCTVQCMEENCYSLEIYNQRIKRYRDQAKKSQKDKETTEENEVDFQNLNRDYIKNTLSVIHNYLLHSDTTRSQKSEEKEEEKEEVIQSKKEDMGRFISQYKDEYGFGIYHVYPEMKPVYKSIKDELIRNNQCKLSNDNFNNSLMKAITKHQDMDEDSMLRCNRYDDEYNIIRNAPINVRHIFAMIVYTSETTFCTAFRITYRKLNAQESEDDVRKKHRQLYYFGRTLCEAIEFYGKEMNDTMKVYHGLNKEMTFEKYTAYFNQPLSTTQDVIIAHQFSQGTGIILTFQKGSDETVSPPKYIDVSWLSVFEREAEKLFYGESVRFSIVDIQKSNENGEFISYKKEVAMMRMLEEYITGLPVNLPKKGIVRRIVKMVKKFACDNESHKVDNDKRAYEEKLFLSFCHHKLRKSIEIKDYTSLPHEFKKSMLYNTHGKLSFIKITKLFWHAEELILQELNFKEMKKQSQEYIDAVKELTNKNITKLKKIVLQSEVQNNKRKHAGFEGIQKHFQKEWQARYIFKGEGIHTLSFELMS